MWAKNSLILFSLTRNIIFQDRKLFHGFLNRSFKHNLLFSGSNYFELNKRLINRKSTGSEKPQNESIKEVKPSKRRRIISNSSSSDDENQSKKTIRKSK